LITRVVFPLWLLVGAVLKMVDGSPSNLPTVFVKWLGPVGVDLLFVLKYTVALELAVVGVVWLLPRLARPVALAMLGAFLPVLVGEIMLGASSCGCFGAVQIPPIVTLAMDGGLLLGVWLLGRRSPTLTVSRQMPTSRTVLAGLWILASFAVGFYATGRLGADTGPAADVAATSQAQALPKDGYYVPDYADWLNMQWHDLAIAGWVAGAPQDMERGSQYVIFYRKDCEHCHELMELFFADTLQFPTTAIAVPERNGFPTEGVLPMPCSECRQAELPAGCDWFMQTPVLVRLENGVVACAAEVDASAPECIQW